MKIGMAVVGGVMVLAVVAGCASQGGIAAGMDLSTPQKTFEVWALAVEMYDEEVAGEILQAHSAPALALKQDILEAVFSARHFNRVMQAWFPENREVLVDDPGDPRRIKAMREFAANASFMIDGNYAMVAGGAGGAAQTGMGFLVRRGGQWRFDLDSSPGVETYPATDAASRMLHLAARMGPTLYEVAREVERGRLTSVEAVKQELARRTNGTAQQVQQELRAKGK